jgi:acyl-CoA reductase-like NAD-dependent aldehyde dehydrogenase
MDMATANEAPTTTSSESGMSSEASASGSGAAISIPCHEPATGRDLGTVEAMNVAAVDERVRRARRAQARWAKTSFEERREVMRELLAEIVVSQEAICELAVRDSGKTMVDAALGEIFPVCEKIRYVIEQGENDLRPEPRDSGFLKHKRARVEYHPLGVVAVICPWNFPFHNIYCPLVPALFAGNAVVCKISEHTSWSAEPLVDVIHRVLDRLGHDRELVQFVVGYGDTGEALVRADVDKVFFTGSPENGVKVMAAASDALTPVVLELGGKDAMIVCDDAELDHAVEQAMLGVYTACGQMCVGAERIYVQDSVYDDFVRRAVARVKTLRQGPPLGEAVDLGAMTMPRQLDILDDLVADAVGKGARVLAGGKRNAEAGAQFFEPTVLVDVDHRMRITQQEQFGPIMVVMRFVDDAEAVRLANDCPYALGSSVFSRDARRAEVIASGVRAGMTVVNDYGLAYMIQSLPFGGVGRSGFGRINGREGLRACCNVKAVVTDRVPLGGGVSMYPVVPSTFPLVRSAIALIYTPGVVGKARAASAALRHVVDVAKARAALRRRGR